MKTKPYNTNNAWGFGGSYGVEAEVDGFTIRKGRACFRHLPTTVVCYVVVDGRKYVDLHTKEGKAEALAEGVPDHVILAACSLKAA